MQKQEFQIELEKVEVRNELVLIEVEQKEESDSKIITLNKSVIPEGKYLWATVVRVAKDVDTIEEGDQVMVSNSFGESDLLPVEGRLILPVKAQYLDIVKKKN